MQSDPSQAFGSLRLAEDTLDVLTIALRSLRSYTHLSKRVCQIAIQIITAVSHYAQFAYVLTDLFLVSFVLVWINHH